MKNKNTIKQYEARGFIGSGVDLETALFEYGLIWKESMKKTANTVKGEHLFIYGIGVSDNCDYNQFDYCYLTPTNFDSDFDWADFNEVARCVGMSVEDWKNTDFANKVYDLLAHYGTDNVFGSAYGGFEVYGNTNI